MIIKCDEPQHKCRGQSNTEISTYVLHCQPNNVCATYYPLNHTIPLILVLPHKTGQRLAMSAILSGRRSVRAVKRANIDDLMLKGHHSAQCELDTDTNTICAKENFSLMASTGQLCDVSGFHSNFESIKDIHVGTVATAYQAESTTVCVLIIHEALIFGNPMDHSLINPIQIRYNGTSVCNNSFDNVNALEIDRSDVFIQFVTQEAAIYFESYIPSNEDLIDCPRIELTSNIE